MTILSIGGVYIQEYLLFTGRQANSANLKSANSWALPLLPRRKFLGWASQQIANPQIFMINPQIRIIKPQIGNTQITTKYCAFATLSKKNLKLVFVNNFFINIF
jgi:hypothetical protein